MLPLALVCLAGCGHRKQARVDVPPPPPVEARPVPSDNPSVTKPTVREPTNTPEAEISLPADARVISVETGMASWYGPPYHNRRGSNGEVYNMNAMTAAHRTLPLGSIVRVTNVKTGQAALVRITDRGPFVRGRILDLSLAAAKKIDLWQPGVAKVKVEVMQIPAPLETGGRWAVQIGSFKGPQKAEQLAQHLSRRYHTAQVATFASPTGDWWLRVRVLNDDRHRAEELASETSTSEGGVFLVRLD